MREAGCGMRETAGHVRIPHLASRIPTWLPALLAAVLGSCATLRNLAFTEPDLQLQEIDVTGIGFTGGTFDLVFDVYNPNDYRIRSTRLEVGIDLEDTHFGDALLERPLDLSPTNHSRVVVPVRFEWAGLGAGAKGLLTHKAVGFGLTGRVFLDTPLGDKTVTLKGRGDRKSTRLNSSHSQISYAVFCLKKKNICTSWILRFLRNARSMSCSACAVVQVQGSFTKTCLPFSRAI